MKKRMLLVAGARPNFMKLAPLWHEMKRRQSEFNPVIVHTGQHYDQKMSQVFFDQLRLPPPNVYLGVGSGSHAQQTAQIMIEIEQVLFDLDPHWVVVFGDVNSTIAVSLVAAKEHYPIAHVEAGLRSFDRTMPEEINRVLTDHLSDLLFITCRDASENLIKENIDADRIYFVGNIMIDTLLNNIKEADQSPVLRKYGLTDKCYALVTLHRPVNVDDQASLINLLEILTEVAGRIPVLFPLHPRTRKNLQETGLLEKLTSNTNRIILTEPLSYLDFLKLQKEAKVVLTDSGGIQEETTVLGVPCLTMRENTERPVTITEGSNRLVGTDKNLILSEIDKIITDDITPSRVPPYWDGRTAGRICDVFSTSPKTNTVEQQYDEPALVG